MSYGGGFGLAENTSAALEDFRLRFETMPADPHLFDGEGARFRRYGRFLIDPLKQTLEIFGHDIFLQDKKYDVLYGDMDRMFPPVTDREIRNPFLQDLMISTYEALPLASRSEPYEVSLHMIRIQALPGNAKGRPAPEGIHRDGYRFGSIHLMRRENVHGAENNVYNLEKNLIDQKILETPLDSIFFNDEAIFHGVSPFSQADDTQLATRDILILLYQPLSESPQRAMESRAIRRLGR